MITPENLHEVMQYHAPDSIQVSRFNNIREAAEHLALVILNEAPKCADQQAAIRKVREAMMTANAAIATNGVA